MKNYKFTKKYDFWTDDHYTNFNQIKDYYDHMYEIAVGHPISHLEFLEIGIFEGRTSTWLLDNVLQEHVMTRKKGKLHCVDPVITKNIRYNLSQHSDQVDIYEDYSEKILIHFLHLGNRRFDFIYVDGDHNACNLLEDLILSWKMLQVNGIMLIDDYEMEATDPWHYVSHKQFNKSNPRLRFTHPRIAIDAFLNIYRGQYDLVINNYQIGIKKIVEFSH